MWDKEISIDDAVHLELGLSALPTSDCGFRTPAPSSEGSAEVRSGRPDEGGENERREAEAV